MRDMDNYLLLQKNNSTFFFVHYPDRYHIISVNRQFTDAKEEKILSETCSDAVIDEMNLTRITILKRDLRGVAIGGCEAGDVLIAVMVFFPFVMLLDFRHIVRGCQIFISY